MSNRLPEVKASVVIKSLGGIGFKVVHERGNRRMLKHQDGRMVVICADNPSSKLRTDFLNSVLKKVRVSADMLGID